MVLDIAQEADAHHVEARREEGAHCWEMRVGDTELLTIEPQRESRDVWLRNLRIVAPVGTLDQGHDKNVGY